MIIEFLKLFVGFSLIGWALYYATWSRVRVVFLRQTIFEIRDALWGGMPAVGHVGGCLPLNQRRRAMSEGVWEFTFMAAQAAETEEQALQGVLEFLAEYAGKGDLEPTKVVRIE